MTLNMQIANADTTEISRSLIPWKRKKEKKDKIKLLYYKTNLYNVVRLQNVKKKNV